MDHSHCIKILTGSQYVILDKGYEGDKNNER
jgi:hypothetical protein